jgi:DNA-binding SARP family transcriptional activator/TolB-like protein
VEIRVETTDRPDTTGEAALSIRLLGVPTVLRGGVEQPLPASRKVLMLLAYLALAERPVGRSQLCDLLWDGPNDPRAELRWALSKLRRLLESPGRRVVVTRSDHLGLALAADEVDVLAIRAALGKGPDALSGWPPQRLDTLASLVGGDLLEGIAVDRNPAFESWLAGQRRHVRTMHLVLLGHLIDVLPPDSDRRLSLLEHRAALLPADPEAHLDLLQALVERRDVRGAEAHLAAAVRLLEADGGDTAPLRAAWHALRTRASVSAQAPPPAVLASPAPPPLGPAARSGSPDMARARPRLAVMPPASAGGPGNPGLGEAVIHDVINRLARLRSLSVIAWGSVSALARRGMSPAEAAQALQADYCASGFVDHLQGRQQFHVELVDVRADSLLWSDVFALGPEDGPAVMEQIGAAVVASLSHVIELAERDRALIKAPGSLNAWETYHRGLWHMYQFTRAENGQAQGFFRQAAERDPTFARAFAGLSFTHWQNAFQRWGDREEESLAAYAAASRSLLVDDRDPTAHWAMGRALWLRGSQDESLAEMQRAVEISPSFALGHYALAFVQSQSGDPVQAIQSAARSRQLSPFDPLLFGIYGSLAMAHARLEEFEEASHWAVLAAAQPNAHHVILAIAAHCLALAGRVDDARSLAGRLRRSDPGYTTSGFLDTFHFSPEARGMFTSAGRAIGLA